MGLIICPECKHSVSEYAKSCPFCGCPMNVIIKLNKKEKAKKVPKKPAKINKSLLVFEAKRSLKETLTKEEQHLIDMISQCIQRRDREMIVIQPKHYIGYKHASSSENKNPVWFRIVRKPNGKLVFIPRPTPQSPDMEEMLINNKTLEIIMLEITHILKPSAIVPEQLQMEYQSYIQYLHELGFADWEIKKMTNDESFIHDIKDQKYWEEKRHIAKEIMHEKDMKEREQAKKIASLPLIVDVIRQKLNFKRMQYLKEIDYLKKTPREPSFKKCSKKEIEVANEAIKSVDVSQKRSSYSHDEALKIYRDYRIGKIVNIIFEYEQALGLEIIHDRASFNQDLYDKDNIVIDDIFSSPYITVNISCIPESQFQDVIALFDALEKRFDQ